ncbi:MAG: hypothetical protein EU548_05730 [Promethearchaeota archaeon]|nr:MAG: hypothetical protein EU548_05730 [Candidatus Lokiarchaeota archaeon]
MKYSNKKIRSIIFIFLLFSILCGSWFFYYSNFMEVEEKRIEFKNPKSSFIHDPIEIEGNTELKGFPNKTGSGNSWTDPYIIEDLEIMGSSSGTGINISNTNKYLVILNCTIKNFDDGIFLENTTNIKIRNSKVLSNDDFGIFIYESNNTHLLNNQIVNNNAGGIEIFNSTINNLLRNNCSYNHGKGIGLKFSKGNEISENNCTNNYYSGIGLDLSNNNNISDNKIFNNSGNGFTLWGSKNNKFINNIVLNNTEEGIYIYESNYTDLYHNLILNNKFIGIYIEFSKRNTLLNNTVLNNTLGGIYLENTTLNTISENSASNSDNGYGIYLFGCNDNDIISSETSDNYLSGIVLNFSSSNTLLKNNASNNHGNSFYLLNSHNNTLKGNVMLNNSDYGISIKTSINNLVYNNLISENGIYNAYSDLSLNSWNVTSFGNFWGNYSERYPNANQTSNDLIWDTPYEIYGSPSIKDYFPLVNPPDLLPPLWDDTIENQTIEFGISFNYDINASDPSGIDQYDITTTANFTINKTQGLITNTSIISVDSYQVKLTVNDTFNNVNFTTLTITVVNQSSPYWDPIPTDQITQEGESFSYEVVAYDLSGIDQYWLNDTEIFEINDTGAIVSNSELTVGEYWLKIYVNDTLGKQNSTIIKIEVQKQGSDTSTPTIPSYNYLFIANTIIVNIIMIMILKKRLKFDS